MSSRSTSASDLSGCQAAPPAFLQQPVAAFATHAAPSLGWAGQLNPDALTSADDNGPLAELPAMMMAPGSLSADANVISARPAVGSQSIRAAGCAKRPAVVALGGPPSAPPSPPPPHELPDDSASLQPRRVVTPEAVNAMVVQMLRALPRRNCNRLAAASRFKRRPSPST